MRGLVFCAATAVWVITGSAVADDYTVAQNNKTFVSDGKKVEHLSIKVGDSVSFRNEDPFFHNIFSLSDVKTFDLGSYPSGESKAVVFDRAGTVEIECAIHPQMHMTVEVK